MCSLSQAIAHGAHSIAVGAARCADRWGDEWRRDAVGRGMGNRQAHSHTNVRVVAAMSVGGAVGLISFFMGVTW